MTEQEIIKEFIRVEKKPTRDEGGKASEPGVHRDPDIGSVGTIIEADFSLLRTSDINSPTVISYPSDRGTCWTSRNYANSRCAPTIVTLLDALLAAFRADSRSPAM